MRRNWVSLISHADFRVERRAGDGTAASVIVHSMASNQDEVGYSIAIRRSPGEDEGGASPLPYNPVAVAIRELEEAFASLETKDWCLVGLDKVVGRWGEAKGGGYQVFGEILDEDRRRELRQSGELLTGLVKNRGAGRLAFVLGEAMALAHGIFDYEHPPEPSLPV